MTASATSGYRDSWLSAYPDACQPLRSAATSCVLCHASVPDLNPYGGTILGHRTTMVTTNDEQTWGLIKSLYR